MQHEGPRGFCKGLSASYLGVTESTLHWMLYEEVKRQLRAREARVAARVEADPAGGGRTWWDHTVDWTGNFLGAGASKGIASILTYPHEVARTRLRQAPGGGPGGGPARRGGGGAGRDHRPGRREVRRGGIGDGAAARL